MSTNWNYIVQNIQRNSCVLLLGPEIYTINNGQQYEKALFEYLNKTNKDNIKSFNNDGLFLFENKFKQDMVSYAISDFSSKGFDSELFDKISKIPFHLIINTTPTTFVPEIFDKKGFNYKFSYYNKQVMLSPVEEPTSDIPLIYNLFGHVQFNESMILTYDDLFNYLLTIFGERGLPDKLKSSLDKARLFVFLGFKFDKWYMQLILKLLKKDKLGYAPYNKLQKEEKEIFEKQFEMEFVEENYDDFINTLLVECKKENLLRRPTNAEVMEDTKKLMFKKEDKNIFKQVEEYIAERNFHKTFECLFDFIDSCNNKEVKNFKNILITKKGEYYELKTKELSNTIDTTSLNIQKNIICDVLLSINNNIEVISTNKFNSGD